MSFFSPYVVYEEHDTASETRTIDSFEASVTLRCDWSIRHAVANDLVGNRRAWPYATGAAAPGAVGCTIRPDISTSGVLGQCIIYRDALLDVSYSSEERDLVSESLEPNVEFLTLDHKKFRWGSGTGDPLLEGEAPGKLLRGITLKRTLYNVEGPLPTTLLSLVGYCNSAPYFSQLLGLAFGAETLMYGVPSMNRTITTNGTDGWTIDLSFLFKPWGWNKFWRSDSQDWDEMYLVDDASPYKNHTPGDFSDFLF